MVFISTTKRNNFDCPLLEQVMNCLSPFFMMRLKHEDEQFGRQLQGVVIEKPRDLPEATELLWMPEMRG